MRVRLDCDFRPTVYYVRHKGYDYYYADYVIFIEENTSLVAGKLECNTKEKNRFKIIRVTTKCLEFRFKNDIGSYGSDR